MAAADQPAPDGVPSEAPQSSPTGPGEDPPRPLAEETLRRARASLSSLVSEDAAQLPSLNVIADAIRLELATHGRVAILYVKLSRYGKLERIFGWRVVTDILDAVGRNLREMVGSSLRKLDVIADFTLSDNAFVVVLSRPRSRETIAPDDLAAVTRRVYERLQAMLLNDLASGVYDRVHPSVGAATINADETLTFEQTLEQGVGRAMEAAERQAVVYDDELEATLAESIDNHELEPLFQPIVDTKHRAVIGYHATTRGPFYSPLRLPDVLADVARRSALLGLFGIEAREVAVAAATGLLPEELLFLECSTVELPNAAILALSEFYSLNNTLVPQHVVFEVPAADLSHNTVSTLRTLANVHEMGFLISVGGLGAEFTALELVAEAHPDFIKLDPTVIAGAVADPTLIDVVQLLVRFGDRVDAQLIAPGIVDLEQLTALSRVGVEIFSGEFVAHADTRLPQVSFKRLGL
jgi:EAL domain-containing protein (putative c-di-GMP-specific phosphodiesterase class I)/GGDEF domain-containing protein